jgi:hypothetical protein
MSLISLNRAVNTATTTQEYGALLLTKDALVPIHSTKHVRCMRKILHTSDTSNTIQTEYLQRDDVRIGLADCNVQRLYPFRVLDVLISPMFE